MHETRDSSKEAAVLNGLGKIYLYPEKGSEIWQISAEMSTSK